MNYIMLLSDGKTRAFYAQNDEEALIVAETCAISLSLGLDDLFKSMLNGS